MSSSLKNRVKKLEQILKLKEELSPEVIAEIKEKLIRRIEKIAQDVKRGEELKCLPRIAQPWKEDEIEKWVHIEQCEPHVQKRLIIKYLIRPLNESEVTK